MSTMNYSPGKKTAAGSANILAISRILILICLAGFAGIRLHAQAIPTASADGELQIGALFVFGNSDYRPQKFKGYGAYAT